MTRRVTMLAVALMVAGLIAFDLSASAAPNPFRAGTAVRYELAAAARVELDVRDVGGRVVRVLARGTRAPGAHVAAWDGRNGDGMRVGSGVYFYSLRAEERVPELGRIPPSRGR